MKNHLIIKLIENNNKQRNKTFDFCLKILKINLFKTFNTKLNILEINI
jgi:hypothetical protein